MADIPPVRPGADQALVVDANEESSEDETHSVHSPKDSDEDDEEEADDGVANTEGLDHATDMGAGPRQSMRTNKGHTTRYRDYSLLADGGDSGEQKELSQAIIRDWTVMFSGGDVSDAKPIPVEDRLEYALGVILQQYSIGAGLKKFQERGGKGVFKELAQMHNMEVFTPILHGDLSNEDKQKAVSSLMFLKEKRDKTIKGRFCTDGRKQ